MSPGNALPAILVHGGAGPWSTEGDRLPSAVAACRAAAEAGRALLLEGRSALDAVEAAVRILEDCPVLDAGIGSYPNRSGRVEMDALIMDGADLDFGAVAAVGGLFHPISLARKVMEDSPHALLVGAGAEAFADAIGFPRCGNEALIPGAGAPSTTASMPSADLGKAARSEIGTRSEGDSTMRSERASTMEKPADNGTTSGRGSGSLGDTVGAVALDSRGSLAAATSTGGTRNKLPGRVGDSPLVGAGGYADNATVAVSATGEGEALMKLVIAKRVHDLVAAGATAAEACDAALAELSRRLGKAGGLIALDARGGMAHAHNTGAMPFAWARGAEAVRSGDLAP